MNKFFKMLFIIIAIILFGVLVIIGYAVYKKKQEERRIH